MHELQVEPGTPLLYVLRNDLGLTAAKFCCGAEWVRRPLIGRSKGGLSCLLEFLVVDYPPEFALGTAKPANNRYWHIEVDALI